MTSSINPWFAAKGWANPYEILYPYESLDAARQVASILNTTVVDLTIGKYAYTANFGVPSELRHWGILSDTGQPVYTSQLADLFNTASPDLLRVQLNALGITALGPPPLGSTVAYESNYSKNPTAKDPGPLPSYALPKGTTGGNNISSSSSTVSTTPTIQTSVSTVDHNLTSGVTNALQNLAKGQDFTTVVKGLDNQSILLIGAALAALLVLTKKS